MAWASHILWGAGAREGEEEEASAGEEVCSNVGGEASTSIGVRDDEERRTDAVRKDVEAIFSSAEVWPCEPADLELTLLVVKETGGEDERGDIEAVGGGFLAAAVSLVVVEGAVTGEEEQEEAGA